MTRRDLTRLFVKFFGLIILVSAVVPLPSHTLVFIGTVRALHQNSLVFGASNAGNTWQTVAAIGISVFGPVATQAVVGLCLLWWNGRIVDKARLVPEKDEIVEAADLENIEIALVAVLGLYFIADGVAELIRSSLSWGIRYSESGSLSAAWNWYIPVFVATLVKLTIGILFVLGRGGSVATYHRAQAWVRKWRTWPY